MIRRQQQDDALGVSLGHDQGRYGRGRSGVAPLRFEHDGTRLDANFLHLFGDQETVAVVADQNRRRRVRQPRPQHRILDHGARTVECQQLLGQRRARQRPQPCTRAARKNDRVQAIFVTHESVLPTISTAKTLIAGSLSHPVRDWKCRPFRGLSRAPTERASQSVQPSGALALAAVSP